MRSRAFLYESIMNLDGDMYSFTRDGNGCLSWVVSYSSRNSHVKNCYYSEISSSTCSVSRQIAGKEPKRTLAKKKEKISSCSASKEIARKKLSTFMHKICCRMMQLFGRGIPIYLFLIENVNMDMRISAVPRRPASLDSGIQSSDASSYSDVQTLFINARLFITQRNKLWTKKLFLKPDTVERRVSCKHAHRESEWESRLWN